MNTVSENQQHYPAALDGGPISHPAPYEHPHPDKLHVFTLYRRFVLDHKRLWGTFRGHLHRREMLQTYLAAKRAYLGRGV